MECYQYTVTKCYGLGQIHILNLLPYHNTQLKHFVNFVFRNNTILCEFITKFHLANSLAAHKINIDTYIRYCTCRFNLKSIKTTLAALRVYVLSRSCIVIVYVKSLCIFMCAIHTWNNKSKLSIYTNVIYMVVWPTHLIENRQRPIWLFSLSSTESDTSRHPIKMHYKQLPAIRLNY